MYVVMTRLKNHEFPGIEYQLPTLELVIVHVDNVRSTDKGTLLVKLSLLNKTKQDFVIFHHFLVISSATV